MQIDLLQYLHTFGIQSFDTKRQTLSNDISSIVQIRLISGTCLS